MNSWKFLGRRQVPRKKLLSKLSPAARISLGYLLLGVVWILFSDRLAHFLFQQPQRYETVQLVKGWAFVFVTSLFLYAICRGYLSTIEQQLKEMSRVNRVLRILSECNQVLVRARKEKDLLDSICRILVDVGGYPLSWIGFRGEDPEKGVTLTARAGHPFPGFDLGSQQLESNTAVISCLRTGKPEVIYIPAKSKDLADEPVVHHPGGRASCIVLPLVHEDDTIGVITIHSNEAAGFDGGEIELFNELAGDVSYGIWALRSSAERERTLQALEDTNQHFRLLVEGATDHAIFMLDPEGRILSWNAGAQRIYGYTQEEILGQSISIFQPEDKENPRNISHEEMEAARLYGSHQSEGWRVRKDGSLFWGDMVLSVLKNEEGKVKGYAKVTRDLTQLRLSEERIRSLNEDLERRVAERTAEIMVANQGLEMFSYSVSHDLRAPLRAISGFAEILSRRHRDGLNEEARHYLANIIEASSRMNHLIDDLLSLAKIGRQAIRHEPVDVSKITDELIRETSHLAEDFGVLVHPQIELDSSEVQTDPSLLRQILLNLISNAITYRRPEAEGGAQVWITARLEGEDLLFEVRDNGIGIPGEYREKIFKPFQRLHTDEAYPGTGIGLAIVKKAADLLSAKVWVDTTEGRGSSFYVQLPQCRKRSHI